MHIHAAILKKCKLKSRFFFVKQLFLRTRTRGEVQPRLSIIEKSLKGKKNLLSRL
jgi:hypothetical protein